MQGERFAASFISRIIFVGAKRWAKLCVYRFRASDRASPLVYLVGMQLTAWAVQRAAGPPQQTVAAPQLPKVRTVQVSAPAEAPPLSQSDIDGNSGRERRVAGGDLGRAGDGTWKDKVLGSDQGFRDLTYLMHFLDHPCHSSGTGEYRARARTPRDRAARTTLMTMAPFWRRKLSQVKELLPLRVPFFPAIEPFRVPQAIYSDDMA
jgi:hypothetical protein